MRLHYHSERDGLTHFVIGLLKGLGKRFDTPLQIDVEKTKAEGHSHDIFHIHFVA